MSEAKIIPIVEGYGECSATPILIRRIALDIFPDFVPRILYPIRIPASRLLKAGEIERAVALASYKLNGKGGIFILLDGDFKDCCPARNGPELRTRAQATRRDIPIFVVLAKMEYEAWFLAAAESLRGQRGLPTTLEQPLNPENIRGAKEWLSARMPKGQRYSETTDQPAFTGLFNMTAARTNSESFNKCYRDIETMLRGLRVS
ncbi:MAG: DUF4276 family protein [Elusimicrobiota bacterium]|nr:DUF4276 family protein [Elusimicrobiota bacterium]